MKKTSLPKINYSLLYVSNAVRKRAELDTHWVTIMGWQGSEQSRYHVSHCHRHSVSHWWLGPYEAQNNAQLLSTTFKPKNMVRVPHWARLEKFSITFSFNHGKRSWILQFILLDFVFNFKDATSLCAFSLQNWVIGKPKTLGLWRVCPSTCKAPRQPENSILRSACNNAHFMPLLPHWAHDQA